MPLEMSDKIELWTPHNYQVDETEKKRKRKRISRTCLSCKSRKVKCDQGRPCSSCVKKNIPAHLCIYDSSPFIPTSSDAPTLKEATIMLSEENEKLKRELEEIKQYSNETTPRASRKILKRFHSLEYKKNKVVYSGPTSWRSLIESKPGFHETIETAKLYISNARREWKTAKNLKKPDPSTYNNMISFIPDELLKNLAQYLPNFFTIRKYLDTYFHSYWHYKNPIVDPRDVMTTLHHLFCPNLEGDHFEITAEKTTLNYSKIALVVSIFKLVLIQTNAAVPASDAFDRKDHLLRFVDRLLVFGKVEKQASIPALQCLLIRHQMKKINPFDDDGGDGAHASLNLRNAINMAYILGLNNDIDEVYADKDQNHRQILRAAWNFALKEDTISSFYQGLPMAINDEYTHESSFDTASEETRLMLLVRRANKILNSQQECFVDELISVVNQIEQLNSEPLTTEIRSLKAPDDYVTDFATIRRIETKLMAIYSLHVLYEVIYVGLEREYPDDPVVSIAFNGIFKYGTLAVTHLIELLLSLEDACRAIGEENKKNGGHSLNKVHNIVEVSSSMISLSKVTFLKAYCSIIFHIMRGLTLGGQSKTSGALKYPMAVDEFEKLDIRDTNNPLNKLFKNPGFLHGLITLACKHMLNINNQSYGNVFNFNFCLYAVIALYKYFNNFLNVNLPKEKVEMTTKIQTDITYERFEGPYASKVSCEPTPQPSSNGGAVNPPRGPNILNPIDDPTLNVQPKYATPLRTNTPFTTAGSSTGPSGPLFPHYYGFFEWKNDAVDELLNNILTDETLFTLDDQNNAVNWSLDEMFNNAEKN